MYKKILKLVFVPILGAIALSYPPRVRVRATTKLSATFFNDESSTTIGGVRKCNSTQFYWKLFYIQIHRHSQIGHWKLELIWHGCKKNPLWCDHHTPQGVCFFGAYFCGVFATSIYWRIMQLCMWACRYRTKVPWLIGTALGKHAV